MAEKFINSETQAIEDLKHLSKTGEIFAYQNESISKAIEALEKQIPKEVDTDTINRGIGVSGEYDIDSNMICPNCNAVVGDYESEELWFGYCSECGQKLKYTASQH